MTDSQGNLGKVLFWINNNELIVANSGKPFQAKNIISICRQNVSTKNEDIIIDPKDIKDVESKGLVSILEKEIQKYDLTLTNLQEDIEEEKAVQKDYASRFLWELLQNADDANTPHKKEQTGKKGIGFKSVLEITDKPHIYSGNYNFFFSKKKTYKLLKEKLSLNENLENKLKSDGLIFRIPHEIEENKIPAYVNKLRDEGYTTIIVLPFKSDDAKEKVEKVLEELKPYQLLFVKNLNEIKIKTSDYEKKFEFIC